MPEESMITKFIGKCMQLEPLVLFSVLIDRFFFHLVYRHVYKKVFRSYGTNVRWGRDFRRLVIPGSIRISCPHLITIGNNCAFDDEVYLQCNPAGEGLFIGDSCRINSHTHIQAHDRIVLEDHVLIAPFCLIASGNHDYSPNKTVIMDRPSVPSGPITIGANSWIGHSSKLLGGASLGTNSVVATGAVVTKKFGRHSLVAGLPAKLIKVIK
jgi:acetyltransferase-like isoleucine patch superfamily enzyme